MPVVTSIGTIYSLAEVEANTDLRGQLSSQADCGRGISPFMDGHILRFSNVAFLLPNLKRKGAKESQLKVYLSFVDETTGDNVTMSPSFPFKEERDVVTGNLERWGGDLRVFLDGVISSSASNRALALRIQQKMQNTRWRVEKHPIKIARVDSNGIRREFDSLRTTFHREADFTPTSPVTGGDGAATTNGTATGGEHTRRAPKGDTLA